MVDELARYIEENGLVIHQAVETSPANKPGLKLTGGAALMNQHFEPLQEPVKGLIVEGVTLLCGAPKMGKSWLALSMACAVAAGKDFLGRTTQQGDVLILALEDSLRRLQDRLTKLEEKPDDRLQFATEATTIESGLIDALNAWADGVENPRLVVIDTLQKVRGATPARANAYAVDYAAVAQVKKFADVRHVAVVLVHHLRKGGDDDDPFNRISGSTGLMGAADSAILVTRSRDSDEATLTITGRDVEQDSISIRFDNGRWIPCGNAREDRERAKHQFDPLRRTIVSLMQEAMGELKMTPDALFNAVAERTGTTFGTIKRLGMRVREIQGSLLKYDDIAFREGREKSQKAYIFTKADREIGWDDLIGESEEDDDGR